MVAGCLLFGCHGITINGALGVLRVVESCTRVPFGYSGVHTKSLLQASERIGCFREGVTGYRKMFETYRKCLGTSAEICRFPCVIGYRLLCGSVRSSFCSLRLPICSMER